MRTTRRAGLSLAGAAGLLALTGCPFLEPDAVDSPVTLDIVAILEPDAFDRAADAARSASCPPLATYGPEAKLSARVEILPTGGDPEDTTLDHETSLQVDWVEGAWVVVGDVTFPRGDPDVEFNLGLELLALGEEAEGFYRGTIFPRGIDGLTGCVDSLDIRPDSATAVIRAAGVSNTTTFPLSGELIGSYPATVQWPPGNSPVPTEITVEIALELLPVPIAFGAYTLGRLVPGHHEVVIELGPPDASPKCPGDTGEEVEGTIRWVFRDLPPTGEPLPDAIGDIRLVRNGACSCCEDAGP